MAHFSLTHLRIEDLSVGIVDGWLMLPETGTEQPHGWREVESGGDLVGELSGQRDDESRYFG